MSFLARYLRALALIAITGLLIEAEWLLLAGERAPFAVSVASMFAVVIYDRLVVQPSFDG